MGIYQTRLKTVKFHLLFFRVARHSKQYTVPIKPTQESKTPKATRTVDLLTFLTFQTCTGAIMFYSFCMFLEMLLVLWFVCKFVPCFHSFVFPSLAFVTSQCNEIVLVQFEWIRDEWLLECLLPLVYFIVKLFCFLFFSLSFFFFFLTLFCVKVKWRMY